MIGQWEWIILMLMFVALLGWELRSVRRDIRADKGRTRPNQTESPGQE